MRTGRVTRLRVTRLRHHPESIRARHQAREGDGRPHRLHLSAADANSTRGYKKERERKRAFSRAQAGEGLGEGAGEAAQTPGAGAGRVRVRVHCWGVPENPREHLERCGPGARRAGGRAGVCLSACRPLPPPSLCSCSRSAPPRRSLPPTPPSPPTPEQQKRGRQASSTQADTRTGKDGCCGACLRADPSPGPCMHGTGHALCGSGSERCKRAHRSLQRGDARAFLQQRRQRSHLVGRWLQAAEYGKSYNAKAPNRDQLAAGSIDHDSALFVAPDH